MEQFKDKIAIVTGAASGIGKSLVEQLARRGAHVVVADKNAQGAAAVAGAIGRQAEAATLDVADADAVRRLIEDVASRCGRLDYLFNNAGLAVAGELRDLTLADWNRVIDVNLRGVIHGVAAAYPLMIRQGFGHIVNTASIAGLGPFPGLTIYAATKHAVVGLSISLRGEARRHGVKVSVACPGFIDTPLLHTSPMVNLDRDRVLGKLPSGPVDPMVAKLLRAVARNRALIVVTPTAHVAWRVYRALPEWTINFLARNSGRNPALAGIAAHP